MAKSRNPGIRTLDVRAVIDEGAREGRVAGDPAVYQPVGAEVHGDGVAKHGEGGAGGGIDHVLADVGGLIVGRAVRFETTSVVAPTSPSSPATGLDRGNHPGQHVGPTDAYVRGHNGRRVAVPGFQGTTSGFSR